MPLFFENPDDRTQPLFNRLEAVAVGNVGSIPVQINYVPHGVYWVIARLETNGARWQHAGNPDDIVEAFQIWLKSVPVRIPDDVGHDPSGGLISSG